MRWVPTPLETGFYAAIAIFGGFLLYVGMTDQATIILLGGASCLAIGTLILIFAVRNRLWHGRMLKQSLNEQSDVD